MISPRLTFLLPVLALAVAARADWSLTSADADVQPHLTVNTFNSAEGLSATDATGKLAHFNTRDIVTLDSARKIATDTHLLRWKLSLRNGDVLFGDPVGISGQSLKFRLIDSQSTLVIPLKSVILLSSPKADPSGLPALLTAVSDKDIVRLANEDRREGLLVSIDPVNLQFAPADSDTPIDIPLASVASVSLGGAAAPRSVPPLSVRLNFTSGSILTVPLTSERAFNWTLGTIKFKDASGADTSVDADRVASFDILGARVVYLSELDPASETQTSFLDTRWPMQNNRNVLGQPLRAGNVVHARGIGVHTQSTIVYDLDGTFDTLTLKVALDDSAAPHGAALASIVLDGKTLWKSDDLKPGQVSADLALPIAGGKRLELHADPANHLDVLGRVDWLDAALRRK